MKIQIDRQDTIVCPYCGFEHVPNEPEYFNPDGDEDEFECERCDEVFVWWPVVEWTWSSRKREEEE